MLKVLGENLDPSNDSLDLMAVDMHILDPELADLLNRLIGDMLDGTWKKGAYAELDIRKGVG
jgi:hypothetical protein